MPKKERTARYTASDFTQQGHNYTPGPHTNIPGDMGYHIGPVGQMDVAQVVLDKGGSGNVLQQMGFHRGTKEYKSAQRAIERHLKGTKPSARPPKSGGPSWQERYQQLMGPPAGTVNIRVDGKIQVSGDIRTRPINATISGDAQQIRDALSNPVAAWYAESDFHPIILSMGTVTLAYQPD